MYGPCGDRAIRGAMCHLARRSFTRGAKDKYCESFGHECFAAAEEVEDD